MSSFNHFSQCAKVTDRLSDLLEPPYLLLVFFSACLAKLWKCMRIWPSVTDGNVRKKDQMNDTEYMTEVADVLDIYIYIWIWFSSRLYLCAWGKPICSPPHLSEDSTVSPLKTFQCWSDLRWPFLILSREIVELFSFHTSLLQAIKGLICPWLCACV